MSCEQSTRPEDTAAAREDGLVAEDFCEDAEVEVATRRCLSGDEILEAEDRTFKDNWVPTPEWGRSGDGVYVLTPSGEDRERYEKLTKTKTKTKGRRKVEVSEMNLDELRERLMIDFACDEQGEPIFHAVNRKQRDELIARLKKKAAAPIGRIGNFACELMGWTQSDIDDMVGNSGAGPS